MSLWIDSQYTWSYLIVPANPANWLKYLYCILYAYIQIYLLIKLVILALGPISHFHSSLMGWGEGWGEGWGYGVVGHEANRFTIVLRIFQLLYHSKHIVAHNCSKLMLAIKNRFFKLTILSSSSLKHLRLIAKSKSKYIIYRNEDSYRNLAFTPSY